MIATLISLFLLSSQSVANTITAKPSIFKVGGGTGFLTNTTSGKQVLVTNWHVCAYDSYVKVANYNDTLYYTSKVLFTDSENDLCITESVGGIALNVAKKDVLYKERIYIVGYPDSNNRKLTYSEGKAIQETSVYLTFPYNPRTLDCPKGFKLVKDFITYMCTRMMLVRDTTAEGSTGSSGSPVLNFQNEVIGVVNSTNGYTLSYIPYRYLINILKNI